MSDRLVIERALPLTLEVRAEDDTPPTLTGHFAVFNTSTVIRSWLEGTFRERIAPGAFTKTIAERAADVRCIYEHGRDGTFGNKPLGAITALREDDQGAYYEVELFDNQLNRDHIIPPARAGQLGASFAFEVLSDDWDDQPEDEGLPIRTIREVRLHEFGPCPFPAYADATAAVRTAQRNLDRLTPEQVDRLTQILDTTRTVEGAAAGTPREPSPSSPTETPPIGHVVGHPAAARQRELQLLKGRAI